MTSETRHPVLPEEGSDPIGAPRGPVIAGQPLATFLRLGDHGRLGNQLFQIAATLGLAHRTGRTAVFPEWEFAPWIDVEKIPYSELSQIEWVTCRAASFGFDSSLAADVDGHISLDGYLQSERYFESAADIVRRSIMSNTIRELAERVARLHRIPHKKRFLRGARQERRLSQVCGPLCTALTARLLHAGDGANATEWRKEFPHCVG